LLLGMIAPSDDVGLFASCQRILVALHAFVWLYYFNLLPSFARAWQQPGAEFSTLISRSLHAVGWVSMAAGTLWAVTAPMLITAVYGDAFSPAGTTLQCFAGVFVVAALSGHYRFGLIAAGRQTTEMWAALLGAVIAATLIPPFYHRLGPAGAAQALLLAEVAVWVFTWHVGRRSLRLHNHAQLLIRPALAATIALGTAWAVSGYSPVLRGAAVLGVFAALVLAFEGKVWAVAARQRSFAGG
jgi:O-antigen/teichoic acid export membrane protein